MRAYIHAYRHGEPAAPGHSLKRQDAPPRVDWDQVLILMHVCIRVRLSLDDGLGPGTDTDACVHPSEELSLDESSRSFFWILKSLGSWTRWSPLDLGVPWISWSPLNLGVLVAREHEASATVSV